MTFAAAYEGMGELGRRQHDASEKAGGGLDGFTASGAICASDFAGIGGLSGARAARYV